MATKAELQAKYKSKWTPEQHEQRRQYAKQWHHSRSEEQRIRDVESLRKFREDRVQQFQELKNKPCMDCGHNFPPVCMDFDHRPSETKLFDISSNRLRKWSVVLAEIAKCDLVCANCHRVRTQNRLKKT